MKVIHHFIDGQVIRPDATHLDKTQTTELVNPSTGKVSAINIHADEQLLLSAVEAAKEAFADWKQTPVAKRASIMFRFKKLVEANADKLGELIGAEHGKIAHDAKGEIQRGIENIEYACGAPELLKGEHNRQVGSAIDVWTEHHPIGVVAGITPFNFPAMVPLWMFPAALMCGNCFILKPSEKVPSTAVLLAELLQQAGLPDGVFNVVQGGKQTVEGILNNPDIKAVSFVGSTPVAEYIYKTATAGGKRCQALGGAKNHAVVLPDCNLDNAVDQILGAAYGSSGERCMAISVAVCVGDETADKFVEKCQRRIMNLKAGASTENSNDFGPLISKQHRDFVNQQVSNAIAQGANLVCDGRYYKVKGHEEGFYHGPSLIDCVTESMDCHQCEIFGPVLSVMRVSTLKEAIEIINRHEYGNGTAIFTANGIAANKFKEEVEVGMVGVNIPIPVPASFHSFGGWKRSLFGDLHAYGPDSIKFYTKRKTITQRWSDVALETGPVFGFPASN